MSWTSCVPQFSLAPHCWILAGSWPNRKAGAHPPQPDLASTMEGTHAGACLSQEMRSDPALIKWLSSISHISAHVLSDQSPVRLVIPQGSEPYLKGAEIAAIC